jgi:hypothetical protein
MWGGVCHTITLPDARTLVRAGMATPSRRAPGSFCGLVFATSEYRTPDEALEVLARRPSATGLARAASQRPRSGGDAVPAGVLGHPSPSVTSSSASGGTPSIRRL